MRADVLFSFFAWLLCSQLCSAGDTLKAGENIISSKNSLVSAGNKFVLGFFSPQGAGSTGGTGRYLGIWYYSLDDTAPLTVVWVANRDKPVVDSSGVFQIAEDGNLEVTDTSGERYWFTELEGSSSTNRTVKLMDSGNLVLLDDHLGMSYLWQSFQHPTDTFLPGMKMDTNLELTSWRGAGDPGIGNFTFKMAQTRDNRYIILKNQSQLYWESGGNGELNSEAMFDIIVYMLMNSTVSTNPTSINNSRYKIIGRRNQRPIYYNYTRLLMNSTGELQFLKRDNLLGDWSVHWLAPASFCEIYNACGKFSSCNTKKRLCKCLPGFNPIPRSPRSGNSGDSLQDEGCARKSASCGEDTTFLTLVMMKMGKPDKQFTAANETECQSKCRKMCPECQAYSYAAPINSTRRDLSFSTCWIWTQGLTTLQEEYLDDYGRNISVRVDISGIAPTAKTCRPCGTNIVPYPLSTGPSCGDLRYFKFSCNNSTGQLNFTTPSGTYRVTSIDADSRKFSIQVNSLRNYCNERSRDDETLDIGFPFNVTKGCHEEDEVDVNWQPPSEPICTEPIDCDGWNHSSCKATGVGKRCLCDANYHWDDVSLSCSKEAISLPNPSSKEPTGTTKGNSKSPLSLILGITLTSMVILACAVIFAYVWRRKITRKQDRESIQRKRGFFDSERRVKDLIDVEGLEEKDNEGIEVPYFDFETILVATDHFSDSNKLGQGGYGPVYKGKLQGGQDIAVKRLSSVSSQGLQEFKNEVVLIAKLQHRNLVRLRGYCIKGDENILLYEYMPNKSLDSLLFDPTQSVLLDWQMRFDIILGVARGLLYLHQDSRLRVIHRDLKTSNILLDEEMQPKISDFGLARIVGGKETEANTQRVVGTYGYMSPEYALDGLFSTKSDIFSFGVVLLEIISGKKNTGFYQSKQLSSLLGYAWRLWTENKLPDLMDPSLPETCNANQFTRCAHIGLLCVQDEPGDRPTMSNVVTTLDSETAILPTPKQPTFFASRGLSSTASSSKPETNPQFSEVDIENCFSGSS